MHRKPVAPTRVRASRYLLLAIPLVHFALCGCPNKTEDKTSADTSSRESASNLSSVEDAKRFAIGVWTNADRPADGSWQKWVVKSDDTIDVYQAFPTDDSWGAKKETIAYSTVTAKYEDTGKRYYALRVELMRGTNVNCILGTDGRLHVGLADDQWFVKGDRFPFSK